MEGLVEMGTLVRPLSWGHATRKRRRPGRLLAQAADLRVYPAGSDRADVLRLRALLALRGVELDALVLVEALVAGSGDGGVVDEHVLAAVIGSDEAEALL